MGLLANWLANQRDDVIAGTVVALRPPAMEDFESWSALRQRSRAFLEPWEPKWDERELTRASFRERVRRCQQLSEEGSAHAYFIFDQRETLVGGITLSNVRRGVAQMASLGYWIGYAYRQKGFMTDAVNVLTAHAFFELGLHRVEAACLPRNEASIRLLKTCKFANEGLARHYLKIAGKWEDHLLFARLAEDH